MAITDEQYVLLTTFKRDGSPVATPVWIADLGDGRAGFYTTSDTGKVKRIKGTPRVILQPCNARGTVRTETVPVEATAEIVIGTELAEIRRRIVAKYGVMTRLVVVMYKLRGYLRGKNVPYGDRGVLITL